MIDAKDRYRIHKSAAKARNVEFKISFDEWYNWWLSNDVDKNHPSQKGPDILCMCRNNDTGAYELSNIYCDTLTNNIKYSYKLRQNDNTYRNGRQRIVKTPKGIFDGVNNAAIALGVTGTTIQNRIRNKVEGYSYDL